MSMLDGVIQCWPLSSACEVWWDAWAVGVAMGAAEIALLGAIAVAYLAYQANELSQTSQREAREKAATAEQREMEERARQERVILSFLSAELEAVVRWSTACISLMEDGRAFAFEEFIASKSARKTMSDQAHSLSVENAGRMLPSFHVCSPAIGLRLGRLLGDLYIQRSSFSSYSNWPDVGQTEDGFTVSRAGWQVSFNLTLSRLRRIRSDAEHCSAAAFEVALQDPA
ncbi:TPA: hypothetical protein ACGY73_002917 [Stenotrophomonas maltophilia]